MAAGTSGSASFGRRRKEPHTVIIARGDKIRHFTVRPWMAALTGTVVAAMAVGYFSATTYLVLRDDLIGAGAARQARMQQAYEDRIAALRTEVDRITSRQLLDRQLVEGKVARLLARQSEITERHGQMRPIIERAQGLDGDVLPAEAPVPSQRPGLRAGLAPGKAETVFAHLTGEEPAREEPSVAKTAYWSMPEKKAAPLAQAVTIDPSELIAEAKSSHLLEKLDQSLQRIEKEQLAGLRTLTEETYRSAGIIEDALADAGLKTRSAEDLPQTDVGGPYLRVDAGTAFEEQLEDLDAALATLDSLKSAARTYPVSNPIPGKNVSSNFGVRRDPFLKKPALHAGMDFSARSGTPIRSAGAGKVVRAGWAGGYGRMVVVDHGNGWTTRYAHMRRIAVSVGDKVSAGTVVGQVGSSGRSTGPHLHFEVRKNGKALDPERFIKAGERIASVL